MALDDRTCTKCAAPLQPGYPLEQVGDSGGFRRCTRWIDGLPRIKQSWLGEYLDVSAEPKQFMLGFSCTNCGLIELYVVTEADLRYHAKERPE